MTDSGAAATFTVNNGATNTFSGLLTKGANALSLTKTGAGSLTLAHVNTYTGATTISAGTLSISSDGNLGTAPGSATPGSLIINGGTLATTLGFTLNANRGISLGAAGATIDTAPGTTLTYNGIAAGPGGLTKLDSGNLVLGGANTYNGTTTISKGQIWISADTNLGSSVFKCKTSRIGPSGPWPSGGCARSSSRLLATPDSSPGSIGPTDSSLTSVHRYAW